MTAYAKTIVCLANSRKMSGRCIAGKALNGGVPAEWVRPISTRDHHEISEEDRRYENGKRAALLDIVSIEMLEHRPSSYQTENHVIDDAYYWEHEGRADQELLANALDHGIDTLWTNGYSSYSGINDRIPLELAQSIESSLALIWVKDIVLTASAEGAAFGNMKRGARARWLWGGHQYALKVTDPVIEHRALSSSESRQHLGPAYVCVSLGEPFNDYVYKLAAAIITPDRVAP